MSNISDVNSGINGDIEEIFEKIMSIKGFQLPTISAVFHFSYPDVFPIVDRNVQAACELLMDKYPNDFEEFKCPILPSQSTSCNNKICKYREFIKFLEHIIKIQKSSFNLDFTFRSLDKALMVYGVDKFRNKVEN